jgi:hypothetical protein
VKGYGLTWLSCSCAGGIAHLRAGVLRVGRGSRSRSSYRRIPLAMSDPREEESGERAVSADGLAFVLYACGWVGGDVATGQPAMARGMPPEVILSARDSGGEAGGGYVLP